jgi:PAS domain S-box-containing protein
MAGSPNFDPTIEERRLALLVNSVTDYAIYMLDTEGRIVTWNPGAQRFKGYAADEIIGERFERFFTPEDRELDVPARALRVAAREGRFESEGWRLRKDGSRFWAHAILDSIRSDDGSLLGFAKITRDITERREREKALFESEQRFRMLVQGVKDCAIFMLDRDGYVTNWNPGAQAIKGYAESEIIGQHFARFYREQDRAAGEPARALATALSDGKYEREAQRVRKDGSLFWAHVLIDPIFNEAGEHVGFAKITRDVTERKLAEQQLQQAQEALLQAQKLQALGELTGGIAHDFNNLMTVIGGSIDMLLRTPDLEQAKRDRYLRAIAETSERATKLTSQLLAFGRRQTLQPEVLDANLRIDALGELLQRTLGSSYNLELHLASSLWRIEVDPGALEAALLNAIVNARDAMPNGGRLTISTENHADEGGDHVCIAIADEGTGIPPEQLARVFEPFFTTKPIGKGTGLGLSQIHGFTAQSGGKTEIQSEVGKGTTLRLCLPRTQKALSGSADETVETVLPTGLKILLVEDNDQVRDFARQVLEELQCTVVEAANAEQALERLDECTAESPFDLVFSDVVMPGPTGIELAERIKVTHDGLPVLLATGYSSKLAAEIPPHFAVLRKPYRPETVAAAFARLLKKRDAPLTAIAGDPEGSGAFGPSDPAPD